MIEVTYLQHMGCDLDVANAARVSFGKESKTFEGRDAKLISYLAEHDHWAPFSHPQASFHIRAPVFVRAQCFKHKIGFAESEISRRYVDDEPSFYLPEVWRGRPTAGAKQGSAGEVSIPEDVIAHIYETCRGGYLGLLNAGVAPEQARMVLPQAMMTEWRWTGSLAAWARFCHLRLAPDAQQETRQVALRVADKMADLFPISWAALAGWRADA